MLAHTMEGGPTRRTKLKISKWLLAPPGRIISLRKELKKEKVDEEIRQKGERSDRVIKLAYTDLWWN